MPVFVCECDGAICNGFIVASVAIYSYVYLSHCLFALYLSLIRLVFRSISVATVQLVDVCKVRFICMQCKLLFSHNPKQMYLTTIKFLQWNNTDCIFSGAVLKINFSTINKGLSDNGSVNTYRIIKRIRRWKKKSVNCVMWVSEKKMQRILLRFRKFPWFS